MAERQDVAERLDVTTPYPGLRPFERHEAEIFFGREQHVDRLLEILQRERFLAVIGPSGSGKSSLVRAGMLPALAAGWLGTGSDWRIVVMRPGDQPFRHLAHGLLEATALGAELGADRPGSAENGRGTLPALVEAELQRGELGLLHLVEDARSGTVGDRDFNLLILVDQFEEIFRYSAGTKAAADEADGFVNLLLASRAATEARIYVALTMRTDFLGSCVRFLELPEAINCCQYLTPRLGRGQLAAAIAGPARVFGGDVEPEVANELINAVADDPDQLPILQHALARMWDRAARREPGTPVIAWQDLTSTGGITDALALHADSVWGDLSPEHRRLTEGLFRAITERGSLETGGRDTRHPMRLGQIAKVVGQPWEDFIPVVQAFSREGVNFLTHSPPLDVAARIDIAHEALIRQWPRLRRWVADEAERAGDYHRWRQRALDRARGGELLSGADLARAIQWRSGRDGWQPTVGWAARYALEAGDEAGRDYEITLAYIAESEATERVEREAEEAAARRKLELDQQRLEAEKRAAEAQADAERQMAAVEREKAEASARERHLAVAHARKSRQQTLVAVAVATVAVILALSTILLLLLTRAAERRARDAEAAALVALREAVAGKLVMQSRAILEGHRAATTDVALLLGAVGYRLNPDNQAYGGLQYALKATPGLMKVVGFPDPVIAVSPDGRTAVTTRDNTLRLWDAATGQPRAAPLQGHIGWVGCAAFSPDGQTLVSGSADRTLRLWDAATGQPRGAPLHGHTDWVGSVAFSPDGQTIASGSADKTLRLWDAATGQPRGAPLQGHMGAVWSVAFSSDDKTLVSGSEDKTLRLWDAATGRPRGAPLQGHTRGVLSVAFSPDGKTLVSGSEDKTLRLWDAATSQPRGAPLQRHNGAVWSVAFSPDGETLVSGSSDETLRLWDAATGQPRGAPLQGHTDGVGSVAFSPDGKTLLSGSIDRTFRLWDPATSQPRGAPLQGHTHGVGSVAFSPDGKTLVSGSVDQTLRLWDAATGQPHGAPLQGHTDWVRSVAFSPDGKTLVSGSGDQTLRLWDAATGQPRGAPLHGHTNRVLSVAVSPDGRTLLSGSADQTLRLWDAATGQPRGAPLQGHTRGVLSVAFSPDGKTLASGSDDKTLRLWDAATGAPRGAPLHGHTGPVLSVAFSPDSKTLLSGSGDKTLRLWDAATGQPRGAPLHGHTDWVGSVAFSPDGGTLLSGSGDKTLRLWDAATGQPRGAPLHGHTDWVGSVAFSPDGKTLLSGSGDQTLRLWDAPAVWIDQICAKLVRNLSRAEWKQYVGDIAYVEQCPRLPAPRD